MKLFRVHLVVSSKMSAGIGVIIMTLLLLGVLAGSADAQDYEVADIDCAVAGGGKELLTARLRKPDGFRGTPIFADDRGTPSTDSITDGLGKDPACQIIPDPTDTTGRVFMLRITDFTQCGVLKRNSFIHVRVWFPQLPGVVMLSDQEVIIMCKPPQPTVTQSKAAGFAGSIPTGARVSGIVEESPGRLEYEVALYRESGASSQGRSSPNSGAYITGMDAQELPVDQAVPIGTRLQLRARINPDSSWQHAKLMEVSVSPDPKDGAAEGSVALIKDGCRNPDLVSIIPKQPYRFKDRTNEVVLDFEAFLLSNMGERNTLWLHTQIKACMESQDCHPEFCMDVYQPSGFGRKRRETGPVVSSSAVTSGNGSGIEYAAPLFQHWRTAEGPATARNADLPAESPKVNTTYTSMAVPNDVIQARNPLKKQDTQTGKNSPSTKFGDNIGFSVVMPAEYYRNAQVITAPFECRGWAAATLLCLAAAVVAGITSCFLSYRLRRGLREKEKALPYIHNTSLTPKAVTKIHDATVLLEHQAKVRGKADATHRHLPPTKYARDSSIYRS